MLVIMLGALLTLAREKLTSPALAEDAPPVVVELFTSQGCSSCPPADDLLHELGAQDNIIALSCHVTYWNYIGWDDPFSDAMCDARQRDYAHARNTSRVYTPEMLFDGQYSTIGSMRHKVQKALNKAAGKTHLNVGLAQNDGIVLTIDADDGFSGIGSIMLAKLLPPQDTPVTRGENRGKTLTNAYIVSDIAKIGSYHGDAVSMMLRPGHYAGATGGLAVFVQKGKGGPIMGAARLMP